MHPFTNSVKHNIDPAQKDEKWVLNYLKTFHSEFIQRRGKIFYNNRDQYVTNSKYALGKQDMAQYKTLVGCKPGTDSAMNTNFDIFPIMPKFVNIITSNLTKKGYNIECNPIDPLAQDEIRNTRYMLETKMRLKELIQEISDISGIDFTEGEEIPDSIEEIELHMELKEKHKMATAMEEALTLIFYINNFDLISDQVDRDLVTKGAGCLKDYLDVNGMPTVRRVDVNNLITKYSKDPYFRSCEAFGEVRYLTVAELESEIGMELTKEQRDIIADKFSYNQTNKARSSTYNDEKLSDYDYRFGSPDDGMLVSVLDGEFQSVNTEYYEKKADKRGNSRTYKKKFGYESPKNSKYKREVTKMSYQVWYSGLWVLGTDMIFNAGIVRDMKVPKSSFEKALSSFHLAAPGMEEMHNTSVAEIMIPVIDDIQVNVIKLRQAVAAAKPKGLAIDVDGLQNISKGKGAQNFKPLELVAIYNETGNQLYNSRDMEGKNARIPITELENGMAKDVMLHINIINFNISLLQDISGLNQISDASTPDPDMLKGVAQLAMQGTSDAIKNLLDARKYLFESVSKSLMLRTQDAVKTKKLKGYASALGSSDKKFIEVTSDISHYEMGIKVEDQPDSKEKEDFNIVLTESLRTRQQTGKGGINLADYYMIKSIPVLKLAQQYLAFVVKRNEENELKIAQQNAQINSEEQRKSNEAAAQQKLAELETTTQNEIAIQTNEYELKDQLAQKEHDRKLSELQLASDLRIKEQQSTPVETTQKQPVV